MKKSQGKKASPAIAKVTRKVKSIAKKVSATAKEKKNKTKPQKQSLFGRAKKKLNDIKKKSSKTLTRAKDKVYATEEEIVEYVKANPIKSISTITLATLIAGFISSRYKK